MARKHYMTVHSERTGERVVSPGEILTKELKKQRITQKELAVLLGRSEKFISQLITGKVRLTYDVAYDLERVLKVPASRWNAAEAAFQEVLTQQKRNAELSSPAVLDWASHFPYDAMARDGLVPRTSDPAQQASALLSFFGVASTDAYYACLESDKGFEQFKANVKKVNELR